MGIGGTILQNQSGITTPVRMVVDSYSTEYRLISHKAFNKDGVEILVNMQVRGFTRTYKSTIEASRTRTL
ncbi:hypothetical protein HYY75_07595 [bacterium]|nr:hypothetical protein [bacterium]